MIICKFTIVFVQFDIPSALGPGSVTAVGIVNSPSEPATSSSISGSSTQAFFKGGWVGGTEVGLGACFLIFAFELPFFCKHQTFGSEQLPGGGIVFVGKMDASW